MQLKTIRLFRSSLVGLRRAGLEVGIGQHVDERDQEVVLVLDRLDLVVRVEDLGLVEAQALGDVLVGVRVDRLLERLAQQVLPALGRGDVAIRAEHDVVGGERVGGDEEAQVALDDQALVVGQAVGVLPQLDVALHVDLLRHPVVGAAGKVLLPRPAVLERHELVDVGRAVDDALVLQAHAVEVLRDAASSLDVDVVHRLAREDASRAPGRGSSPACAPVRGQGGRGMSSSKVSIVSCLRSAVARLRGCLSCCHRAALRSFGSPPQDPLPLGGRGTESGVPGHGRGALLVARQCIAFSFSYRNSGAKSCAIQPGDRSESVVQIKRRRSDRGCAAATCRRRAARPADRPRLCVHR